MHSVRLRLVVAALALIAALWLAHNRFSTASRPLDAISAAARSDPAKAASAPATDPAACLPQGVEPGETFTKAVAARAARDDALAKTAAFTNWLTDWRRADVNTQPALAARGRELAIVRRAAMKHLIATDPKRALEEAIPSGLRTELPDDIQKEFEQRVDTRADLDVTITHESNGTRLDRIVRSGESRYRAYVFGRRDQQQTKYGLPLHGIAVDDAMALEEKPYRALDDAEKAALGHTPEEIVVKVGGKLTVLAGDAELADLEKRLVEAESAIGPHVPQFSSITGGSTSPDTAAFTSAPSWINGTKRVLWLKIDFADDTTFPFTDAQIMANSDANAEFYAANSQGKTTLVFSILPAVLRMPQPKSYYNNSSSTTLELYNAARDAAKAYDQANGDTGAWNPEKFDRYIVLHSQIASYGFTGVNTSLGGPQVGLNATLANTTGHELGHTQSLYHSHFWLPSGTSAVGAGAHVEYGDLFDRMGTSSSGPDNHFNVSQKAKLGYLDAASITSVTQNGTYRINRHDHKDAAGMRALKIVPDGLDYEVWLEHRRFGPTALTAAQLDRLRNGVLLHWGTEKAPKFTSGLGSYLIDATPGSAGGVNDAPLRIGETFIDPDAGVTIKPLAVGGTAPTEYIDVQVTFGASDGNRNPTVVAEAPAGPLQARTNVVFTASGSDPDGDPIYFRWNFGDGTFQPNLDNITRRFTKGGKYNLRVSTHDGKGGVAVKNLALDVADPLVNWTTRTSGTTNLLYDVTYTGGQFVAVGINRTILVSTDGASWSSRPYSGNISLTGITSNGSRYVASGYNFGLTSDRGIAAYSDDGNSWTTVALPTGAAQMLWNVTYGAGRFVLVGDRGVIMSSPDGATWTAASTGVTTTLRRVAFADGLFVATGDSGRIFTSSDGLTWTNRSVATANALYTPVRHNGAWYTLSLTSEGYTSIDGQTWTRIATAGRAYSGQSLRSIAGVLLAPSSSGAVVFTEDPSNWVAYQIEPTSRPTLYSSAEGNGTLVVVGSNGSIFTAASPAAPASAPLLAPALRNDADSIKVAVGRKNQLALTGAGFTRYELYANGVKVGEAAGSARTIDWTPLTIGSYSLIIRGINANGFSAVSAAVPAAAGLEGWEWRNPLPAGANLNSAVNVGGKWWIVGNTGTLLTLDANGTFTPIPFPTKQRLSSIVYANGRFVIGAYYYDSAAREDIAPFWTSTDGVNWTSVLNDQGYYIASVIYGGGRWMGFSSNSIFSSTDGINWSRASSGVSNIMMAGAFGNGLYAVVTLGGRILTSPDGTTWTSRTSGVTTDLLGLTFNNGLFVAAGSSGVILTSPDGVTWTPQTSPVTSTLNGVGVVKGSFVISGSGGVVLTSINGTAWTPASVEGKFGDLLIAAGSGNDGLLLGRAGEVFTATDPATWRRVTQGTGESKQGIVYAGGKFVAVSSNTDGITRGVVVPIQYSTDGTTWTRANANPAFASLNGIAYGQDTFVAVGPNSAIFTSPDGITWTQRTLNISSTLTTVTSGPNGFIAGSSGQAIYGSANGTTWAQRVTSLGFAVRGSAFGSGRYVVVGDGGNIRHSADGTTWSSATSGVTANLLAVGWWEEVGFIAAGSSGTMLSSQDGITWQTVETRISDNIGAIAKTPVGYVAAAGLSGSMIISIDGKNWDVTTIPADRTIRGMAASANTIVAVGDQGAMLSFGLADASRPIIAGLPANGVVAPGSSVTLSLTGPTIPAGARFQWTKDGVAIAGATAATYTISGIGAAQAGTYSATITTATGNLVSAPATLALGAAGGRLINLSVLTSLSGASDNFTFGVVVGGGGTTGAKPLLVRAVGPSLAPLGVTGFAADPKLEFFTGSTKVGENDNWGGSAAIANAMAQVGAFPFVGSTSRDAAMSLSNLANGGHSMRISATGAGTVLAELYDASPSDGFTATTSRMINVSVLKNIGTGVTAGFVIGGGGPRTVLIRAIGPTLGAAPFNVPGVVADPQLALYQGQTQIKANDNWGGASELSDAFTQVAAFPLPATSRDAAVLARLEPGNYTVQVSGVGGTTGVALIEVYEVPE